jgi:pterin-4a-carbinolamine dehydratase
VSSEIPGREPQMRTELYRSFEFSSFDDAIAFMGAAVPTINQLNHHPRWENLWRTVSVWLTTWDIGHRISPLDIDLAMSLDQLRNAFAR